MSRPLATALDELVPAAAYEGSLTDDDQAAFDALVWHDERAKPSWSALATQAGKPDIAALEARAQAAWSALLVAGQTFNVAASGEAAVNVLCDGTNDTRADLALLALFGQTSPTGTKAWLDNTGKVTILTGAQLVTLATLAGNWVSDTYPALVTLLGEIAAGTVTTAAEIDAYAWPTS